MQDATNLSYCAKTRERYNTTRTAYDLNRMIHGYVVAGAVAAVVHYVNRCTTGAGRISELTFWTAVFRYSPVAW